jgi:hypothetical protein
VAGVHEMAAELIAARRAGRTITPLTDSTPQ